MMAKFVEKYLQQQEGAGLPLGEFAENKFLPPLTGDAQVFQQCLVLIEIIYVKFGPELTLPRADADRQRKSPQFNRRLIT